ncbi:MAG: polysaccharide pyruvyl transferase family protein [Proteobacteria bacterium]|nr:polysaccharide pyruvyl transferase family protein [Pseudomonadota bacterium]
MLKLYYWNDRINFGDALAPLLFERVFSTPTEYASLDRADVASIGSLLQFIFYDKNTRIICQRKKYKMLMRRFSPLVIWGSGALHERVTSKPFRSLDIRALRGHITQQFFSPDKAVPLGDPGLLADRIMDCAPPKQYRVGIIPHHEDKRSPLLSVIEEQVPGATVIDVEREPLGVLRRIMECDSILSSSLHGLVVADSLGIPNQWIELDGLKNKFGLYKFHDYYSVFEGLAEQAPQRISANSLGLVQNPEAHLSGYARPGIEKVKQQLQASFPFR